MKLHWNNPFAFGFIVVIILLDYPRFSNCRMTSFPVKTLDATLSKVITVKPTPLLRFSSSIVYTEDDYERSCPPHTKLIATKTFSATQDSVLNKVTVNCQISLQSEYIVNIRYANNSMCACAKVGSRLQSLKCKNKLSNVDVRITISVDEVPTNPGKSCLVLLAYFKKGLIHNEKSAEISDWRKNVVTSNVVPSIVTKVVTVKPTPPLRFSSSMWSSVDEHIEYTEVISLPVKTLITATPTVPLSSSSSLLSSVDPIEQQYMEDLNYINKVNTSTVDINDTKTIQRVLDAVSNLIRSNRTTEDEEKMEPGIKAVSVLQDLGKTISRQLNLGNKSQVMFQKTTNNLVFGVAAINTRISSSAFAFPSVDTRAAIGRDEKIEIPQSVFTSNSEKAFFVGIIFNGVREMRNKTGNTGFRLGSKIINAEISPPPPAILPDPVILTFEKRLDMHSLKEECSFWIENSSLSGEHGKWSTKNCMEVFQNKTHIKCACYHFTNFAVLFKISNDQNISEEDAFRLLIITYVGLGLSILGCFLTFVIYVSLRNLKSDRSTIHTNLVLALGIADVIFLVTVLIEPVKDICLTLTMLAFFFYLAVFFWMFVEGIYIYLMVIKVFRGNTRRRRRLAYLVGWGCPVVIAVVTWVILRDDVVSKYHCWLSVDSGAIWAFVAPGLFIIVFNIIILIAVMRTTWATFVDDKEYGGLRSAVKTFGAVIPILGITWVFGVMAFNEASVVFQYIFAITNSIQGILIFILYCLVSNEVRNEILRRVTVWQSRRDVTSTSGTRGRPTYVISSDKLSTFNRTTLSANPIPDVSLYPLNDPLVKISRKYSFEPGTDASKDSENELSEFAATSKSENNEVSTKTGDQDSGSSSQSDETKHHALLPNKKSMGEI